MEVTLRLYKSGGYYDLAHLLLRFFQPLRFGDKPLRREMLSGLQLKFILWKISTSFTYNMHRVFK